MTLRYLQMTQEDWVRSIDRGGLKYVSDMTYTVFISMEKEVRKIYNRQGVTKSSKRDHRTVD